MAVLTIIVGLALIIPTAIWVHLRFPRARVLIETFALLPFVIPPIVLVFGLIRLFSRPPLALVTSPALLIAGYVVLSFPYMFRAIDAGLRAIDLRVLTEAAQSLGAGWGTTLFRVVLPNIRVALLSAAFLTFSIVVGELTLAVMLAWPAFGPYMALVGRDLAYEPAALAIVSFLLTWGSIALMQVVSRGLGAGPPWAACIETGEKNDGIRGADRCRRSSAGTRRWIRLPSASRRGSLFPFSAARAAERPRRSA